MSNPTEERQPLLFDVHELPKVLTVYLELSEYPIMGRAIRQAMRRELFERGVITPEQFEREVEAKAISTQEKEGLNNPLAQEPPDEWAERLRVVRENLTDFYFALNLPHDLLERIVRAVLGDRKPETDIFLTFNAELAPWDILFAQAEGYEQLSLERKAHVLHHLQEIVVVIIRGMISDQLGFVGVAREYLNIFDLKEIRSHRIGRGKIGGKAAGMMLAYKVLQQEDEADPLPLCDHVAIPESYFIGADVFYDFMAHNELFRFSDQKYKKWGQIEADYPEIRRQFCQGEFPREVVDYLEALVRRLGKTPLIVRSSSLLEDNFGMSFAGKYESYFCPNQGTDEENLQALLAAVRLIYASVFNPEVTARDIKKYSQHSIDLIDLSANELRTLPLSEVVDGDYPFVELLASVDEGDYIHTLPFRLSSLAPDRLVLTFDRLLGEGTFVPLMKAMLQKLERAYGRPVDVEFTAEIVPERPRPRLLIHILQCRPLSSSAVSPVLKLPQMVTTQDIVFTATRMVPDGIVTDIEYIVYVDPAA